MKSYRKLQQAFQHGVSVVSQDIKLSDASDMKNFGKTSENSSDDEDSNFEIVYKRSKTKVKRWCLLLKQTDRQ